jgi:steroid 5-alpha reductase family enzyme
MSSFAAERCDLFELTKDALLSDGYLYSSPTKQCALVCIGVAFITFVVSSACGNYSQVDKLWSIVPLVYTWLVVCDARTLLMAVVATIWGVRLTWNFNRRGGYRWPPWTGDEDYRWKILQEGFLAKILMNKIVWASFNFGFISLFQNFLLLLIATPSIIANLVATSCGGDGELTSSSSPLNIYDYVATFMILALVVIESIADNQQYAFQTEKYRRRNAGEKLEGDYADGFNQSGLYSVVRKPNYAAEQAIWICFYLFSIGAVQGERFFNWSISGCILLCLLFQGSGWFTENISLTTYPVYKEYMKTTPLFVPSPFRKSKKAKAL